MKIYKIYKKLGQTPLQALENFRRKNKILPSMALTYAGRLDPMAEGVLLILSGATQAQKEKYLSLPKVYLAEILLGFSTDSYDVLGLAKKFPFKGINRAELQKVLRSYKGFVKLGLPKYSSPPVNGKPLFVWARQGTKITIPVRNMEIKKVEVLGYGKYSGNKLLTVVESKIAKVTGDFRQERILQHWNKILTNDKNVYFSVNIKIHCGSGTYVRSLADDVGKKLGSGSVLLNLKRLAVGKYKLAKALK